MYCIIKFKDSQISITEDTFQFPTINDPMINQEENYSKNVSIF